MEASVTEHRPSPIADAVPRTLGSPEKVLGMLDLVLRGGTRLDEALLDERSLPGIVRRLLVLSLGGMAVHGLVVGFAAQVLHPAWGAALAGPHPVLWMPVAFVLSFLGAIGVCLPSFYFYTQLSGLDASFRLVTAQALRAQATTSVLLLGVLPFYAAAVLSCAVFGGFLSFDANGVVVLGMILPFGVGLFGIHALYRSFRALAQVLPITHVRRGAFLGRMVLCWGMVYSAVAPVALWRIGEALSHVL
jgi:hypothetical protein